MLSSLRTHFYFSLTLLTFVSSALAQPTHQTASQSSSSTTPLNPVEYAKQCDASFQQALEIVTQEAADALLPTLVYLEASNAALARKDLPDTFSKMQKDILWARKERRDEGMNSLLAGTFLVPVGIVSNLNPGRVLDKQPALKVSSSLIATAGAASIVIGGYKIILDWPIVSEKEENLRGEIKRYKQVDLRLNEYVDVYGNILQLNSDEKNRLKDVLEKEISTLIAESTYRTVKDLKAINILDLVEKNNIGSQLMVTALRKVATLYKQKQATGDQLVTKQSVEEQVQALRSIITLIESEDEILKVLPPYLSKVSPELKQVRRETLTAARTKLTELEAALKALPVDCKK